MSQFEQAGIEMVLARVDEYARNARTVNAANKQIDRSTQTTARRVNDSSRRMVAAEGAARRFAASLTNLGGAAGPVGNLLATVTSNIAGFTASAGLAVAAIGALAAGVLALAFRGAALSGVANSFSAIARSIDETSDAMVGRLRDASSRMISDFELMRMANQALIGTSGEFRRVFAEQLPTYMRLATIQAAATGDSVERVFQQLTDGLQRGRAASLASAGVIVNATEANEQYAASIGKTVAQLTEQEKRLALLQAAAAAASARIDEFGNVQETAADKMARINARIANIFDRLAWAIQPAFEFILDRIDEFIAMLEGIINVLAPIIHGVLQLFFGLASEIIRILDNITKPIRDLFGGIIQWIIDRGRDLLMAGARLMGELANGIYYGLNRYVMPAVIDVATTIADFLVGQSPPPKGPLNKIMTGGANVMAAWMAGFAGVSMDPVRKVSAEVAAAMGNVAHMSLEQVEKRLARLDKAIAPFEQRLQIVKANFEALREPAEAALRAIDRQMEKAVQALARGEEGSAELVRQLDMQRAAIEGTLDAQQQIVDNAEVQLALARAQQQRERTLLNIRRQQLGPAKAQAQAAQQTARAQAVAATGRGGAGVEPVGDLPGIGEMGPPELTFLDELGMAFAQPLLDPERGQLGEFITKRGELDKQMKRLQSGVSGLGDRISESFAGFGDKLHESIVQPIENTIGDAIAWFTDGSKHGSLAWHLAMIRKNGFKHLISGDVGAAIVDWIQINVVQPFENTIADAVAWFTDSTKHGTLAWHLAMIRKNGFKHIVNQESLVGKLLSWVDDNLVQPFRDGIDWLTNSERDDGLISKVKGLPQAMLDAIGDLGHWIDTSVFGPVRQWISGEGGGGLPGLIQDVEDWFAQIPTRIQEALRTIGLFFWNAFAVPIIEVINYVIKKVNEAILALNEMGDVLLQLFGRRAFEPVQFEPIPTEPPGFLTGAATGGVFSGGLLRVGERGEELVASASPMAVFNNKFIRAMDALSNTLVSAGTMPSMPGMGSMSTSNDNSIHATFNNAQTNTDIMNQLAMLRAMR